MTKKSVRGLLDTIGLAPEEWELEAISEHYVPGIGLGATDDAKRWAYAGYRLEINGQLENAIGIFEKKKGRPAKSKVSKVSSLRAFHMWLELRRMPEAFRAGHTNRKLIAWIRSRGGLSPKATKLWKTGGDLERSLSEGRTFWDLTDEWQSQKCEDYLQALPTEKVNVFSQSLEI